MQTVNLLTIYLQLRVEGQTIYYHFFKKKVLKRALKSSSDGRYWPG